MDLMGVSVEVPAPRDCSLPEEAHIPDGLVLQLWPEQRVGLGQDGDKPAAKGHNLPSAPPGQDQSAGSGCCPQGDGPGREAGRSPGTVLSSHGGSWAAATGPGEAGGRGGKGTGPGPRYSQEVAAHSGGD